MKPRTNRGLRSQGEGSQASLSRSTPRVYVPDGCTPQNVEDATRSALLKGFLLSRNSLSLSAPYSRAHGEVVRSAHSVAAEVPFFPEEAR